MTFVFSNEEKEILAREYCNTYIEIVQEFDPLCELEIEVTLVTNEKARVIIESSQHKLIVGMDWKNLVPFMPQEVLDNGKFTRHDLCFWTFGYTVCTEKFKGGRTQSVGIGDEWIDGLTGDE